MSELVVTGLGVTSAVGQGRLAFSEALMAGRHRFDVMRRPGRQWPLTAGTGDGAEEASTAFLGAEIPDLELPGHLPAQALRTASLSARVAVATLHEAWLDAGLDALDPLRIGLVVGGSNVQQREIALVQATQRFRFLRPTYGLSFMDSDICGLCTELFGIRAFAHTVGGASASGQVAVIQAIEAVRSGNVDVCIALGALMDLSSWECQAFRALGAMGSDRHAREPERACRPFDQARDGFIFGECCGAIVVESAVSASRRGVEAQALLTGWAMQVDGNRQPNPSLAGEMAVIRGALAKARWQPGQVDYVKPHGSGSVVGDETELQALQECGLGGAHVNSTKSIIGHGLSAAGAVEIAAVVLQMKLGRLHPSRNLEHPISSAFEWVRERAIEHRVERALSLSMGFGGVNTALCLQRI